MLVNLDPIAILSKCRLNTSSREHLEDISHANRFVLLYNLITSGKDSDEFFQSKWEYRKRQYALNDNKILKGKYLFRFMLKDVLVLPNIKQKLFRATAINQHQQVKKTKPFKTKLRQSLMLGIKLITSIGMYLIIQLPFHKKAY